MGGGNKLKKAIRAASASEAVDVSNLALRNAHSNSAAQTGSAGYEGQHPAAESEAWFQPYPPDMSGFGYGGQQATTTPMDTSMDTSQYNMFAAMNNPMTPFNNAFNGPSQQQQLYLQQQNQMQYPLPSGLDPYAVGFFNSPPPLWNSPCIPFNFLFPPPGGFMNFDLPADLPHARSGQNGAAATASPAKTERKKGNNAPPQRNRKSNNGSGNSRSGVPALKAPAPTDEYMAQASLPPKEMPSPEPLLIILDLNGTLLHRKHRRLPPRFVKRAGLDEFLNTLMDKYTVMIWSSSQPPTVRGICDQLFHKDQRKRVIAEWGRDKFGLSNNQYREKVQVYKRLETVWANESIQATYPRRQGGKGKKTNTPEQAAAAGDASISPEPRWGQRNTVLIDDNKLKALSQPYNILEIPEFDGNTTEEDSLVFPMVLDKLENLSRHDDVSKVLKRWSLTNKDVVAPTSSNLPPDSNPTKSDQSSATATTANVAAGAEQTTTATTTTTTSTSVNSGKTDRNPNIAKSAPVQQQSQPGSISADREQQQQQQTQNPASPVRITSSPNNSKPASTRRSASPVSVAGDEDGDDNNGKGNGDGKGDASENYLLDRLEESLGLKNR